MSIYTSLWQLKFPRDGDCHTDCEWVEVLAQGVPAHIGTPTPGHGYEDGDPYGDFLPPPVAVEDEEDIHALRAIVVIARGTPKGTARSHQEYVNPLLVLGGQEYAGISFADLHKRICDALRGDRSRLVGEVWAPDGTVRLVFKDGSSRIIRRS
jgi:hypothetical protein